MFNFNKKIALLLALISTAALLLTGCIQMDTVVTVNKDGSGTVTVTQLMAKEMITTYQSLNPDNQGKEPSDQIENPFGEEEMTKNLKSVGEGLTFEKYEPVETDTHLGGRITFSFADINTTTVQPFPDLEPGKEDEKETKEPVRFSFTKKGSKCILTAQKPVENDKEEKKEMTDAELEQELSEAEMMKQFLKGLFISFSIEVEGKITKCSAKEYKGSKVTILSIDFDKIIENDENFKLFIKSGSGSEAFKKLNKIDGIVYEEADSVTIEFK